MRTIVAVADTHGEHEALDVPDGDVFVHAGDFTRVGRAREVEDFAAWLASLPHRLKIVVAGNHDWLFERAPPVARAMLPPGVVYLEDEAAAVDAVRYYGSPWQPEFHSWAFNLPRGPALAEKWSRIPAGLDVLITHGPPHGVLDRTWDGRVVGCEDLLRAVRQARPRVHVFGHIHEDRGVRVEGGVTFVNATTAEGELGASVIHLPDDAREPVRVELR